MERRLAMEVRLLDEVAIDDANARQPGGHEEICGGSTDGAAADEHRAGSQETSLAVFANAGKEHLPGILFVKRVVHQGHMAFASRVIVALFMIALKLKRQATLLCYASSEPLEA